MSRILQPVRSSARPTRCFAAVTCALLIALLPSAVFRADSSRGLYLHFCSDSGVHVDSVSRVGDRTELSHNHECRECDPCGTEVLDGAVRNCDHGGGLVIFGSNEEWSARSTSSGCSPDSPASRTDGGSAFGSPLGSPLDSPARSAIARHHRDHAPTVADCVDSCVQFLI